MGYKKTNEVIEIDPNDFLSNRIVDLVYTENPRSDEIGEHIRVL